MATAIADGIHGVLDHQSLAAAHELRIRTVVLIARLRLPRITVEANAPPDNVIVLSPDSFDPAIGEFAHNKMVLSLTPVGVLPDSNPTAYDVIRWRLRRGGGAGERG